MMDKRFSVLPRPFPCGSIHVYVWLLAYHRHMVSTLQALRGGQEVLLATLDVFLNEPVVDWLNEGVEERQQTGEQGET